MFLLVALAIVAGQNKPASAPEMYRSWCAQCHGEDGTGRVATPTVKTPTLDFTRCKITTSEADADWELVVARGGPAAGLSSEMPAFDEAATADDIRALVQHLRTFCHESGWPSGNLNFPRPIFLEKAFPEDELIVSPVVTHRRGERARLQTRTQIEKRFGKRSHLEMTLPFETVGWPTGRVAGVGDVEIGGRHVVYDNPQAGIVSLGMDVEFPTGSTTWGFGEGTTIFEPYVSMGTMWQGFYVQEQVAVEIQAHPFEEEEGRAQFISHTYLGRDLDAARNTWTIGLELNTIVTRLDRFFALTPQLRKGLTPTGALAAAGGVRIPLNGRAQQGVQVVGYVLWEFLEPVRPRK